MVGKQMPLFDERAPENIDVRKSEWRVMSTYQGGHALFWGINAERELKEIL